MWIGGRDFTWFSPIPAVSNKFFTFWNPVHDSFRPTEIDDIVLSGPVRSMDVNQTLTMDINDKLIAKRWATKFMGKPRIARIISWLKDAAMSSIYCCEQSCLILV
jgi:hypothetical protein